jgi:hypothetical protein
MLRTTTSHLLIATLLICPYLCLGEAAGAIGASHHKGGCSCTRHADQSSRETPQPCDENEPDCLCHGAIIGGVRSAELEISAVLSINWLVDDTHLSSIKISSADACFEPHFPPHSTGREICMLTCVLLI